MFFFQTVYHGLNGDSVKNVKINTAVARDTFSETIEEMGVDIKTHVTMFGVLSSISTLLLELLVVFQAPTHPSSILANTITVILIKITRAFTA